MAAKAGSQIQNDDMELPALSTSKRHPTIPFLAHWHVLETKTTKTGPLPQSSIGTLRTRKLTCSGICYCSQLSILEEEIYLGWSSGLGTRFSFSFLQLSSSAVAMLISCCAQHLIRVKVRHALVVHYHAMHKVLQVAN